MCSFSGTTFKDTDSEENEINSVNRYIVYYLPRSIQ